MSGDTIYSLLEVQNKVPRGGPAPPVPLPQAPRVSHQRGGPAWLHAHHEPTLSRLNSVKQHIN